MNMPVSNMIDILIYGCEALEDMPDIEVRDEWNMLFGESEKDVDKD